MTTPSSPGQGENVILEKTNDIKKDLDNKENVDNFDKMGLKENLLRGIYSYGFEKPSMIQQQAIVPFSTGNDIIAQAQSGTGKTATYTIGLLQQIDTRERAIQGLILTPTRELADQVKRVVQSIGDYMDIDCHACIGGTNISKEISILKNRPHVIVGTPGRVMDMINRGILDIRDLKTIILDEADEVLSLGFSNDVDEIFRRIPESAQIAICSATLPPEVKTITSKLLRDPVKIEVKPEKLTLDGIRQYYVDVDRDEYKFDTLCDLFTDISVSQTVIFCNSNRRVDQLTDRLLDQGFPAASIHGQKPPAERSIVMERFRGGNVRVLICSDLLARGIDVQSVSIVINYDLPSSKETYLHRIGRGGRFGRRGIAINLITGRDVTTVRSLEQHYDIKMNELPKNVGDLI